MHISARLLLRVLLALALAAFASAQERTYFKAAELLGGYEERREGAYADLIDFTPFEELYGEFLEDEKLAAVQEQWRVAVEAADTRIAKIESEPAEARLYQLECDLRGHDYFANVDFERIVRGPFVFFVKPPTKKIENYAPDLGDGYAQWMSVLLDVFEREIAVPFGLKRRADYPLHVLYVLDTRGAYVDLADAMKVPPRDGIRAHYEPALEICVTYQDPFGENDPREERQAALHETVHSLHHAYYAGEGAPPMSLFLNEGLAEYLSYHDAIVAEGLGERRLDVDSLISLALTCNANPTVGRILLLPLEELAGLGSYYEADAHLRLRAVELSGVIFPANAAIPFLYIQSAAWMYFLHHGQNGRYKGRVRAFLKDALGGAAPREAFARAFDGVDLSAVDREFLADMNKRMRRRATFPSRMLPLPSGRESSGATREAVAESAPTIAAPFSIDMLALDGSDPGTLLAGAVASSEAGRYREALATLRQHMGSGDFPERGLWELEVARTEALELRRDRFLRHLKKRDKYLRLEVPQGDLAVKIKELTENEVVFKRTKLGLSSIAIDEVRVDHLMKDSRYKFAEHVGEEPYVLAVDGPVRELIARTGGAGEQLIDSWRQVRERWLVDAQVVGTLSRFVREGLPEDLEDARAISRDVASLLKDHAGHQLIAERDLVLREFATESLAVAFRGVALTDSLKGSVSALGGDRYRLHYDFEQAGQLDDFTAGPDHWLEDSADQLTWPTIGDGGPLRFDGPSVVMLPVEFEGDLDMKLRMDLKVPRTGRAYWFRFYAAVCADGLGSDAHSSPSGDLMVFDGESAYQRIGESRLKSPPRGSFELELSVRGDLLTALVNGKKVSSVALGPRTQGGVYLASSCPFPVSVYSLTVEGTVSSESMDRLRAGWVAEELEQAGL